MAFGVRILNAVSSYFAIFCSRKLFIEFECSDTDVNFADDDDFDRKMHPQLLPEKNEQRATPAHPEELEISYWKENAQKYLKDILAADSYNTPKRAKSVILFLGDGMSLATVAAARMYMGGEEKSLSFEKFPHFGLSKVIIWFIWTMFTKQEHARCTHCKYWPKIRDEYKQQLFCDLQTYCVDKQVADSACTSTAYLNGVKANYGTMGINAQIKRGDCLGQNKKESHTESIAAWAFRDCKAAGLVTTSRVTHASPGGLYARKIIAFSNVLIVFTHQSFLIKCTI